MKKGIILSLFLLLNFSCQSEKTQELEQKVSELEKKNEELQYYLDNSEYISIVNSQLRGIPELRDFKVNEKGIINFGFWKYGDIKNYKIYMKRKGDENFDLIYDNLSNAQFKLEFTPKSLEKPKMAHYVTADLNRLTIGKYGIKEVDSTEIYEGTYDIILVPGLVFSADGYRVGYGGGYYDFFLAHHPEALKVGVGFPFQLAEKIPVEKHDVQLDKLILGSTLINIK